MLHAIVTALHGGGTQISAVGDPNQSVLGFTGASPAYLLELRDRPEFDTIQLDLNYRSAASLVSAAARFIDSAAPTQRHVRDVEGVIHHIPVEGDQSAHASEAVSLVQNQLSADVPPGEIALLYPRRGTFLTALLRGSLTVKVSSTSTTAPTRSRKAHLHGGLHAVRCAACFGIRQAPTFRLISLFPPLRPSSEGSYRTGLAISGVAAVANLPSSCSRRASPNRQRMSSPPHLPTRSASGSWLLPCPTRRTRRIFAGSSS